MFPLAQPIVQFVRRRSGIFTRGAWIGLCAILLVIFAINQLLLYAQLQRPCVPLQCREEFFYLSASEIADLHTRGISVGLYAAAQVVLYILFYAVNVGLGTFLFWRDDANRQARATGMLLALLGTTFPDTAAVLWTAAPVLAALLWMASMLTIACLCWFYYTFPNGRFVPRWLGWVALAVALALIIKDVLRVSHAADGWIDSIQLAVFVALLITVILAQALRYRYASSEAERRQTRWVVFGIVGGLGFIGATNLFFLGLYPQLAFGAAAKLLYTALVYAGFLLLPLTIAIAIVRSRLWDINLVISRTLIYAALTGCVAGLYAAIVLCVGAFLRADDNALASVVAIAVVAMLFQPLRSWLQRAVNRLIYGDRDEPYAALTRFGQRLEATLSSEEALPTIVETVAQVLRLPYVAITLADDQGNTHADTPAAACGAPPNAAPCHTINLAYHGVHVGALILAPRPGDRDLAPSDRRLLAHFARQAGVVVHAARLAADLRRSRESIIAAREEERRRIRRDLHDGLGPVLATLVVQLDIARALFPSDQQAADMVLAEAAGQTRAAIVDVRRLVYALRPPALDDLGLVGALRVQANATFGSELQVWVDAPEQLPPLPAAIEVAAYRIVQEALTNVLKHADARTCRVVLTVAGVECHSALLIEVCDDGVGLPQQRHAGVGLVAMRERAEEVGGTCAITRGAAGGTRVSVCLPL